MHIRTGGDTSDDGNQQERGLRGNTGAPRGQDDRTRDPHSLPVSTVQALIDQWRAHKLEAARAAITTLRDAARQGGLDFRQRDPAVVLLHEAINALGAALLASPSLPHAQWQPIESAPKEGAYVLITDGICLPDIACWLPDRPERVLSSGTRYLAQPAGWFNVTRSRIHEPKWWLQIPASPSLHRQEQKEP